MFKVLQIVDLTPHLQHDLQQCQTFKCQWFNIRLVTDDRSS